MTGDQNPITPGDKGMPRIVAGVHGTAASDAALDWATREARLRRAQLHLVLARDPAVARRAPYAHPAAPASGDADAGWLARAAVHAARMLPQGQVSVELANGLPARILADRAAGASLLVLGAAPAGFLGPVARACLRQAPCPVVIVVPDSGRAPGTSLLLPKLRIDVVVQDEEATAVADSIAKPVRTGAIGDGKIWMCPVDGALRVRTGERDHDAV